MKTLTREEITARIRSLPKARLTRLPTPLIKLEALSRAFGGPEIYVKRDDLTGLAFGGNKSRKLEYIMGDALAKKADSVITWGSVQSNWCLQTAAASRKLGIKPILVLFKNDVESQALEGNLLLDRILESDIRIMDTPGNGEAVPFETYMEIMNGIADGEREKGGRPYIIPVGGSMTGGGMTVPLGAFAYVEAFAEMLGQAQAIGFRPDAVVHATGSCGTQAGLIAGARAFSPETKVIGICVSRNREALTPDLRDLADATSKALGLPPSPHADDVLAFDEYIKDGYGVVNEAVSKIIRFVFEKEGLVLDPVYTAKGMIGLQDLVARGYFRNDQKIVFFHTGGTPALFALAKEVLHFL